MLPVESLETRVLLSASNPSTRFFTLSSRDILSTPVVIVPLVVHTAPDVVRPARPIEGPISVAGSPESQTDHSPEGVAGMAISGTVDLNPPSAMIAMAGSDGSPFGVQEASDPIMTVASYSPSALDEGSVPPLIVVTSPAMATTGGDGIVTDPLTWSTGAPPSMPVTNPGVGVLDQGPGTSGGGEMGLADIPEARHVEFESMLDSTHSSMSISIPVGPATAAIDVSLHPTEGDEPQEVPVLDDMVLVDRNGDPIAQLGPFVGPQAMATIRALTVSLDNAPVGGSLLVQVSLPMVSPSGSGTTLAAPQSVSPVVPFMMDIQRQDVASALSSDLGVMVLGPLPGQVGSGIGTLANVSTTAPDGNATDSADSSNADADVGEQTIVVDQGNAIPPSEDSPDSVENRNASLDVGMGTGPLVSRSSAPLGPMLATLLSDPAPPVDRHERALLQAIEESGLGGNNDLATRSPDETPVQGPTSDSPTGPTTHGISDGTLLASAGLGAFPLKVTGAGGGDPGTDLESLLVTLPGSMNKLGPPAIVAAFDHENGDISVSVASAHNSSRADHRIAPNLLTAACGLALGLGLTTRPLLPDLLALVPTRFSRSKRSVPGSKSGHESNSEWGAGLGNWFRGPLTRTTPSRQAIVEAPQ